ncbi:MAG: hypothetical protein AAGJ10_21060, partial [Bacteroidota bacterium]
MISRQIAQWCLLMGLAFVTAHLAVASDEQGSERQQQVTQVSGVISGSAVWTKAESPYLLTGDVTLGPGHTLTIEAGVEVRVSPTD